MEPATAAVGIAVLPLWARLVAAAASWPTVEELVEALLAAMECTGSGTSPSDAPAERAEDVPDSDAAAPLAGSVAAGGGPAGRDGRLHFWRAWLTALCAARAAFATSSEVAAASSSSDPDTVSPVLAATRLDAEAEAPASPAAAPALATAAAAAMRASRSATAREKE